MGAVMTAGEAQSMEFLVSAEVARRLQRLDGQPISERRVRQWVLRGEQWLDETASRMGLTQDEVKRRLRVGHRSVRDENGLVGIAADVQASLDEAAVNFPLIGTRIGRPGHRSVADRWVYEPVFVALFEQYRNLTLAKRVSLGELGDGARRTANQAEDGETD